jgi:hypothetical protein
MVVSTDGTEVLGYPIQTFTGVVNGARSTQTTTVTDTATYLSASDAVIVNRGTHVTRTDSFRLVGQQGERSFSLTGFNVDLWSGQVVTMCHAQRHGKWIPLVLFNHTEQQRYFNDQELFRLASGGSIGFVLYVIFTCLCTLLATGYFALAINRQLKGFRKTGVQPLSDRAWRTAAPLMPRSA